MCEKMLGETLKGTNASAIFAEETTGDATSREKKRNKIPVRKNINRKDSVKSNDKTSFQISHAVMQHLRG